MIIWTVNTPLQSQCVTLDVRKISTFLSKVEKSSTDLELFFEHSSELLRKSRKINDKRSQEPQLRLKCRGQASSKQKLIIQDNREISLLKIALITKKGERQRRPSPFPLCAEDVGCNRMQYFLILLAVRREVSHQSPAWRQRAMRQNL